MLFPEEQQNRLRDVFAFFAKKIAEIRQKRLLILSEYEEKKKNRRIEIIKGKITKL